MRFGGIVLAALLALSACSSDPLPKEPDPTATTARPTGTPPTLPAQAKQNSPEGAAAFVKHYIDVFNYASNTGNVEELSRLSAPACEGCQRYIRLYRDTYEAGGYFKGSDWKLTQFELKRNADMTTVFVHARSDAGTRRDDANSEAQRGDAEDSELVFVVETGGTDRTVLRFERSVA